MTLTQVSANGIKDATVANADLANEAVNEAKLQISNAGSNGQYLQKQSGNTGGLTWATPAGGAGGATGLDVNDDVKVRFGTGNDLQIYHDPQYGHSWIKESGGGSLGIATSMLEVYNSVPNEKMLTATEDGAVELYHNGVKKFETTSDGWKCADSVKGVFGDGDDLKIRHTSDVNFIESHNGQIHINKDTSENMAKFIPDGAVELYYDDSKKFETKSYGVDVTGEIDVTTNFNIPNDTGKFMCGASNDLQIYHNGSNSRIVNSHAGQFSIASDILAITNGAVSETMAKFTADGAAELYYNNVRVLETHANGIFLKGPEGGQASLYLYADEGDDDADKWRIVSTTGGELQFENKSSGSWASSLHLIEDNGINVYGDSQGMMRLYSDGSHRCSVFTNNTPEFGWANSSGNWVYRMESDGDYQHYGSEASDRDRKDNITTVTGTSLDKITKLVPKTYNWKNEDGKTPTDKTFTGFIAQEVQEHLPSLVTGTDGQKNMALDYKGVLAHAVKAITELSAKVETLETKMTALEAK